MSDQEVTMERMRAGQLFDPALRAVSLHLQLGGRVALPQEIAARIQLTLERLRSLDSRSIEWAHVNAERQRVGNDDILPGNLHELALSVADGERKDSTGKFHPSFGYFVSILGFLEGSDRKECPFDMYVTDGRHGPHSADLFNLRFDEAAVTGHSAIIDAFCSLVEIWEPVRGAIDGHALAKLHRNDAILYPPVGVLTYFANNSGYTLPESPLVDLRVLKNGTVAVLKEWTFEANLEYEKAFAAVNEGIPNRRLRTELP